jgi:RHS repeat-associated protein
MNAQRTTEHRAGNKSSATSNPKALRSRARRLTLNVSLVVLLLLSVLAPSAVAQKSKCDPREDTARIGFVASVCSFPSFTITLNDATVSGSGSCDSNNWVTSNKAYTYLKVNQTYQLTAGTDLCSTHVAFDVPDDYYLEVNGVESETFDVGGAAKGSGDGIWSVVLRRRCPCSEGGAGASAGPQLGSVSWDLGLGYLPDGRSAEGISLHEDSLSNNIYTPAALVYTPPGMTSDVDVVRSANGSLRQIKAPQTLADIVVISATEYDIRFYRVADVGAKVGGVYSVSGQPFVTWKVKNPNPPATERLQISKIQNGVTDTSEYIWDAVADTWSLTRGGGTSVETKTVIYPTPTSRIETSMVKDNTGQLVSKVTRTFRTFPWGEELVEEVNDPDGAALKSTHTYYENPSEAGRYGKLATTVSPDGSWARNDYDADGNRILTLRPWKNQPLASATEANSRSIRYTYSNSDGVRLSVYAKQISSVEEKIAGVTVSKTTFTRSNTPVNGEPAATEVQTTYYSASAGLPTATTTYHSTASPFLANKVASILYPDGRKDTYTYEKGFYTANATDPSLSQFTPNANGNAQRETIVHATVASPGGVPSKTTKETSVTDQNARLVLQEGYIFSQTGSYERVAWTAMDYDDRSHPVQTRRNDGRVTTSIWSGDRKTSEINDSGIESTFTYDALGKVKTQTRKGVAASGSFPAQPDITTTYTYDTAGRETRQTVTAGTLTLTTSSTYDTAGRIKTMTDETGLVTTFTYTNGGRTQTATLPGGAMKVTDRFLDGQASSMSGTAVVAKSLDYGVNPDGTRYTQIFEGSAGLASPRWTKNTVDMLGRNVLTEKPSFNGTNLLQSFSYNDKGQLKSETVMAGTNRLIADKLYEYDELGNQSRIGLDVNADGVLTPLSIDRITDISNFYQGSGPDWFKCVVTSVYLTDNNSSTVKVQEQRERLTNFPAVGSEKTVSEIQTTDYDSTGNTVTVVLDRTAKKATARTAKLTSNVNEVSISYNGLLQSSTPATPQTATTYAYDALGRLTSTVDPRTGTTSHVYDPTTGRLTSTTERLQTTAYEYYPATHLNAGRIKSQANTAGKKSYFNYNSRGEMIQSWGDMAYPQEYVFDSYGQRVELHTFSSGSNWQSGGWPSATTGSADVTRWIYDEATGLLARKQDDFAKYASYTYDALGRTLTRRWARTDGTGNPLTTTYSYHAATGDLSGITYSDNTPAVTFTQDRSGRHSTIVDAAGTRTRGYNVRGDLSSEQISGGLLDGVSVNLGYDNFLRRSDLRVSRNGTDFINQTYGYDSASRFSSVTYGNQTATYTYKPTSGLLDTTAFTNGTNISRAYDPAGRLTLMSTTPPGGAGASSHAYTYNNIGQRTRITREDGSYWSYTYNDRGEVVSGKKYWADNSPVAGQQNEYGFDNIGSRNLVRSGGDSLGNGMRSSAYIVNALNQYVQRTVPGAIDVNGTASTTATVTVNNQTTERKGEYFNRTQGVDNSTAPVYAQTDVVGAKNNVGSNGEDAVARQSGRIYLSKAQELYDHDADGNLISDGRWNYTWDAENRLTAMEAIASAPLEAKKRLEFAYDFMGRRIQKKVFVWNTGAGAYQLQAIAKFVNDGWNPVVELDGNNSLVRSFVWGQDIDGRLQGAAGMGGLLLVNEAGSSYIVGYDGSENVTTLVKASDGTIAASYEYGPFGEPIGVTGAFAARNPIRFSTKYTDIETGLVYFGYRYYNPQTGRWISRDPISAEDSPNLYSYVVNSPVNFTDPDGLQHRDWRRVHRRQHIKTSANWDYASGQVDHTFHHVVICIKKMDLQEALTKIYADFETFAHFNEPTKNIAGVSINGNYAHFDLDPGISASFSFIIGNSVDVVLVKRPEKLEMMAMTIGDHPLVGVRKWTVRKGNLTYAKTCRVEIETEAYEQASLLFNRIGRWMTGRGQQDQMWTTYLANIADHWYEKIRAQVIVPAVGWVEPAGRNDNPYKSQLPADLQSSKYKEWDEIIQY